MTAHEVKRAVKRISIRREEGTTKWKKCLHTYICTHANRQTQTRERNIQIYTAPPLPPPPPLSLTAHQKWQIFSVFEGTCVSFARRHKKIECMFPDVVVVFVRVRNTKRQNTNPIVPLAQFYVCACMSEWATAFVLFVVSNSAFCGENLMIFFPFSFILSFTFCQKESSTKTNAPTIDQSKLNEWKYNCMRVHESMECMRVCKRQQRFLWQILCRFSFKSHL